MALVLTVIALFAVPVHGEAPPEIPGWGTLIDPDGDCAVHVVEQGLVVQVPGTLHDLSVLQKDPPRRTSAPRIVREITGDFEARVKITGDFVTDSRAPGSTARPAVGAGLLIWDSSDHFFKWGRCMVEHEEHGRIFVTTPEYHIHDRTATQWGWTDRKEYLETRTLWYRIQREGPVIRVAFSPDGQVWTVAGELRTVLPKTVKVGLYVFNTTSTAQSVGFQTYHVGQD